ncbi:MAG: ABC transporter ATP-binding protein/permease [Thermoanaerobaculia bacterium]|nr:ABC transporter ATP-binding protein/permease [Thermoanaerobaculia bacterium]
MSAEGRVNVYKFLWRYFRRYVLWGGIALGASLLAAAGTAGMIALVEPIFAEVLLSDERPSMLGSLGGSSAEGEATDAAAGSAPASDLAGIEKPKALTKLEKRLDLKRHFSSSYRSLKRRWNITGNRVIWFSPLLLVLVLLIRSLAMFVNGYAFQRIGLGGTTDIRNALYERILEQSSRFYSAHPSGELVSRVVNDIGVMQNAISTRMVDILQQPLALVILIWLLLSIHLKLAVMCLVVAPVILYPIVRFGRGMRRTSHRSQEHMADLANLVAEGVRGHRVVKAFNMEDFEYRRFRKASHRHLRVNLWAQMLSQASSPIVEALAALGGAALLIYAGQAIRAEELDSSEMVMFLVALFALYDPVRKLNKVNLVFQQAIAAGKRVRDIMAIPVDVREPESPRPVEGVKSGIHFSDVVFAYDTEVVLDHVDLDVKAGEVIALVGPSGAGKTSLVNLLPRYFDPDEGRILIDDVNVREFSLAGLRQLIGIVTQETVLFNDTIRNNIAYGQATLPQEQVEYAARAAYAHDFIEQLPDGYDTVIGESGSKLSGGQRQRLAIARAILKDAPVLILDEATSQLDSESEALVQKALGNLMRQRTTLVIAHRLSTVVNADRIVVMEGGRIVDQGKHQELLSRGGTYKRLYDLQFEG